jgi:hypothetical protein
VGFRWRVWWGEVAYRDIVLPRRGENWQNKAIERATGDEKTNFMNMLKDLQNKKPLRTAD